MMFPGPFTELYVASRLERVEVLRRPSKRPRASGWRQRAAHALVRVALELDREQTPPVVLSEAKHLTG